MSKFVARAEVRRVRSVAAVGEVVVVERIFGFFVWWGGVGGMGAAKWDVCLFRRKKMQC